MVLRGFWDGRLDNSHQHTGFRSHAAVSFGIGLMVLQIRVVASISHCTADSELCLGENRQTII